MCIVHHIVSILHCASTALVEQMEGVEVQLEKTSWNSRKLFASINIEAPIETVWGALTDYDGLQSFIPSLIVSRGVLMRSLLPPSSGHLVWV